MNIHNQNAHLVDYIECFVALRSLQGKLDVYSDYVKTSPGNEKFCVTSLTGDEPNYDELLLMSFLAANNYSGCMLGPKHNRCYIKDFSRLIDAVEKNDYRPNRQFASIIVLLCKNSNTTMRIAFDRYFNKPVKSARKV